MNGQARRRQRSVTTQRPVHTVDEHSVSVSAYAGKDAL